MYANCVVCGKSILVDDVLAQIMVDGACLGQRCIIPCLSCRRTHSAALEAAIADLRARHAAAKAEACGTAPETTPSVKIDGRMSLDRAVNAWCLGDRKDVFSVHVWNSAIDFAASLLGRVNTGGTAQEREIQSLADEIRKAKV